MIKLKIFDIFCFVSAGRSSDSTVAVENVTSAGPFFVHTHFLGVVSFKGASNRRFNIHESYEGRNKTAQI